MSATLTDDQHSWVSRFCGVDTRDTDSSDDTNQNQDANANGAQTDTSANGAGDQSGNQNASADSDANVTAAQDNSNTSTDDSNANANAAQDNSNASADDSNAGVTAAQDNSNASADDSNANANAAQGDSNTSADDSNANANTAQDNSNANTDQSSQTDSGQDSGTDTNTNTDTNVISQNTSATTDQTNTNANGDPLDTITIPPVVIATGGDRAFQFFFAQVRTDQGAIPESGDYAILVMQGSNELGRAQGKPGGVGMRIETAGFLVANPVVSVTISGTATFTKVIFDGDKFSMQTGSTNFSVSKAMRLDPKAKEYSFQVSRVDDSKNVSVKTSELRGSTRESVAAAKVGVGVDKVISVSGDLSSSNSSGSKSESGQERTETWAVKWYTGDLALAAV